MQLYGRVFLMAVCVFSAYAFPNLLLEDNADGIYETLIAQVRSALIETRALSPGEAACANQYNNNTQTISNKLTNETNACFDKANSTKWENTLNANATTNQIRASQLAVQQQLANCSLLSDITQFLNCTTATFDQNLLSLDNANSLAYVTMSQMSANASQVDIKREGCINSAIGHAKTNLTVAANDYNNCLQNVKNQRQFSARHLLN